MVGVDVGKEVNQADIIHPGSGVKLLLPSYTQETRGSGLWREEKVGKEKKREEGASGREGEAGRGNEGGNEGCQNEGAK